jgi:hypothetical protein
MIQYEFTGIAEISITNIFECIFLSSAGKYRACHPSDLG